MDKPNTHSSQLLRSGLSTYYAPVDDDSCLVLRLSDFDGNGDWYCGELALPNAGSGNKRLKYRYYNGSAWSSWVGY